MYTLEQTNDKDLVGALHIICMPSDPPDLRGQLWVCYHDDGTPVAYCTACDIGHGAVFLSSAGVLPCARGAGLQRRMIRARIQWARTMGASTVITYTVYDNYASIVNLLKCGFEFYTPHYRWVGKDVHYFIKDL